MLWFCMHFSAPTALTTLSLSYPGMLLGTCSVPSSFPGEPQGSPPHRLQVFAQVSPSQ